MKTIELQQGSKSWHAHRLEHYNASDAPAMLGVSQYKTRTQLLHEISTGDAPEVDAATQKRFDNGHRFEALARPLAENIIGQDLFPVIGVNGKLSASFDGLIMDETICFEHKTLNDELRSIFKAGNSLPELYLVQMEQQLMVSGATKCLFMASSWDENDQLIEEQHRWHEPDPGLRDRILQGWKQFKDDLKNFKHIETSEVMGRAPEDLPALQIEITGMVKSSNLEAFHSHAMAVFEGINKNLKTDEDFANADKTTKWCKGVETRLAAAKQHALSQTASIDELFRTLDSIGAEARLVRLDLEKAVKSRKEAIRHEIKDEATKVLTDHIGSLNERLGKNYMPAINAAFAGAMKGKKTVESLNDAVATTLANAKIEANAIADKIDKNLKTLRELAKDYTSLFPDTRTIVLKENDDLMALVKTRIAEHKEAEETKKREAEEKQEATTVPVKQEEQSKADNTQPEPAVAQATRPASTMKQFAALTDYQKGYVDSLRAFAYVKDGIACVGNGEKTLTSAIDNFLIQ